MSNLNSNKLFVPEVVKLQTDDSSSTSEMTSNLSGRDVGSNEKLDSGEGDASVEVETVPNAVSLSTLLNSTPIIVAHPSLCSSTSFDNLTVSVAIPINPPTSKIIYARLPRRSFNS